MIDDLLFQRGHIFIRIGENVDDFDNLLADYYFEKVLDLKGEVTGTNGSSYELIALNGDSFEIDFTVAAAEFETEDGDEVSFDELIVKCTGVIAPEVIWEDPLDVLQITTFDVLRVI